MFIQSSPIKSIQWARPTGDLVASRGDLQITSDKELALEGSNLHRFASGWYRCVRMDEGHLMVGSDQKSIYGAQHLTCRNNAECTGGKEWLPRLRVTDAVTKPNEVRPAR